MREAFTSAMKEAMKAGDKDRLGTIRLIQAALKDKDIENRGTGKPPASEEEILGVLQKMVKQRQDSITLYKQGGREDLVAKEEAEVAVITGFLPAQMSEDEVKAAIAEAVGETGAASVKDMGKVIAVLRAKYAGRMDFGRASGLVKAALAG